MTHEVREAARIMGEAAKAISGDPDITEDQRIYGLILVSDAIRHIARPDRSIFPKVRRSSKRRWVAP